MVASSSPSLRSLSLRPSGTDGPFRTLAEAATAHPEANVVSIAVPGPYATFLAERALDAGRHLFISTANLEREDEIALKRRALELGLLVMGPDCATAILAGVGLGYANRVPRGPVGIVGTSGSAIQEVACGLTHLGVGVSHAIGCGSHDLEPGVDGIMTELAMKLLAADPDTKALVLLTGRTDEATIQRLLRVAAELKKPVVLRAAGRAGRSLNTPAMIAADLDDAVRLAAALARGESPTTISAGRPNVGSRAAALLGRRTRLDGRLIALFAGGARAREAHLILGESGVDAVLADRPLAADGGDLGQGNLLIDFGAEFYAAHHPHPLIDQRWRCAFLKSMAADRSVEVLLFDVVLGDGVHPDPATDLAAALVNGRSQRGDAPLVAVASVCGTDSDPQDAARQRSVLAEAGVQMTHSVVAAARLCAALKSGARGGVA